MLIGKSIIKCSILLFFGLPFVNIFIKNGISKKSFSEYFSILIMTVTTSLIIWMICKNIESKFFQDVIMKLNGVKTPARAIFGIYSIAILGIFMDIISNIISNLDEKKDKTLDIPWKIQFKKGIEDESKYIGEKINIIILIVLSILLFPIAMNINNNMSFIQICSQSEIFVCFLSLIISGIGVVISVPVTSCIYACLNRKKIIYKTVSENKVDGKRSLKL